METIGIVWGLVRGVRWVLMAVLMVGLVGCGANRGWQVQFGVNPISATNDQTTFRSGDPEEWSPEQRRDTRIMPKASIYSEGANF